MRTGLFAALLLVPTPPAEAYSFLWGAVGLASPTGWGVEVSRVDGDSLAVVAWSVPRPAKDTAGPAANVIVTLGIRHDGMTLKRFGDEQIREVSTGPGSPELLSDHETPGENLRDLSWTSNLRGTMYMLWDRIVVRDSVYIDVRTAIPGRYTGDSAWMRQYQAGLDTIVHTLCVGGRQVFPKAGLGCANIARVLPFTQVENADGARFVFFMLRRSGLGRPTSTTAQIPRRNDFREISADSARGGDLVWWPSYVGIYSGPTARAATDHGTIPVDQLTREYGTPPRFFRPQVVVKQ